MLTFTTVDDSSVKSDSKDYWLVHDHSYRLHHVVDGQQRLTTCVIFIQAFVEFVRAARPAEIRERNEVLLRFMEKRWNFALRGEDRSRLLFVQA